MWVLIEHYEHNPAAETGDEKWPGMVSAELSSVPFFISLLFMRVLLEKYNVQHSTAWCCYP